MLVGYMRVSKADGSQTTNLQRDALLAEGVDPEALYEDRASGKKEDRPELAACVKSLRHGVNRPGFSAATLRVRALG